MPKKTRILRTVGRELKRVDWRNAAGELHRALDMGDEIPALDCMVRALERAEAASAVDLSDAKRLLAERNEARAWVADLQAGMYVNCVYCGHRFGPESEMPVSMADVLTKHIEGCPQHPLSKALVRLDAARALVERWRRAADLRDPELDHKATSLVFRACADELEATIGGE